MQKNVLQLCRMTRYVCAQKDSVRAVSCADECRGVKVKIAVLCISVFQPVREILLAELLKGGVGNDYLQGGYGADSYLFSRGDGQDSINNYDYDGLGSQADSIQFGSGIAETDVTATKNGSDLVLTINNTSDSIRVHL